MGAKLIVSKIWIHATHSAEVLRWWCLLRRRLPRWNFLFFWSSCFLLLFLWLSFWDVSILRIINFNFLDFRFFRLIVFDTLFVLPGFEFFFDHFEEFLNFWLSSLLVSRLFGIVKNLSDTLVVFALVIQLVKSIGHSELCFPVSRVHIEDPLTLVNSNLKILLVV